MKICSPNSFTFKGLVQILSCFTDRKTVFVPLFIYDYIGGRESNRHEIKRAKFDAQHTHTYTYTQYPETPYF